jgi:hypothetical protein
MNMGDTVDLDIKNPKIGEYSVCIQITETTTVRRAGDEEYNAKRIPKRDSEGNVIEGEFENLYTEDGEQIYVYSDIVLREEGVSHTWIHGVTESKLNNTSSKKEGKLVADSGGVIEM